MYRPGVGGDGVTGMHGDTRMTERKFQLHLNVGKEIRI